MGSMTITDKCSSSRNNNAAARGVNVNNNRKKIRNAMKDTETVYREELLRLLSEGSICIEYGRSAWLESIQRDIDRVREELMSVERALCGSRRKGKKSKAAKNTIKETAKEE